MFADYNYYTTTFGGNKIKSQDEYKYLAQEASRYIKRYTKETSADTQDCECALSEYLQSSKKQGNMTSESIPSAYSVSWSANDSNTQMSEINKILALYLGDKYSSVGIAKIIN